VIFKSSVPQTWFVLDKNIVCVCVCVCVCVREREREKKRERENEMQRKAAILAR
jgi:hypothetical protein